jgi:uncharacterized membrane protein required for colicin V production
LACIGEAFVASALVGGVAPSWLERLDPLVVNNVINPMVVFINK